MYAHLIRKESKMTPPGSLFNLSVNPFLIWTKLALTTGQMMLDSAFVIAQRTNQMARSGPLPSVGDQREFVLMGTEKLSAAVESAQAMALSMISLHLQLPVLAAQHMLNGAAAPGQSPQRTPAAAARRAGRGSRSPIRLYAQISTSVARLAHKGLKPIPRARENAKRLANVSARRP
jgi:hypothetical protein